MSEPILVRCPHCQKKLKVGSGAISKSVRCPVCRGVIGPSQGIQTLSTNPRPRPAESPNAPAAAAKERKKATPGDHYKYGAFISYRHVDPDRRWAYWLHTSLETYRVPGRLVKEQGVPPRLGRVFRDEEELAARSDLGAEIRSALESSRALIVVCSPRTPGSEWVNKEVEYFRSLGRHDRILALLIEGEPAEAFPRALREIRPSVTGNPRRHSQRVEEVEPLAADVRRNARQSRRLLWRNAKLRLLATLLQCSYDGLRQREMERRRRQAVFFGSALAGLLVVLAGLTVYAMGQRNRADKAQVTAQENLEQANKNAQKAEGLGQELGKTASKLDLTAAELTEEFYYHTILQVEREVEAGNLASARTLLETKCAPEFRGWEWYYFLRRTSPELLTLGNGKHAAHGDVLAVSPDGLRVAAAGPEGKSVQVWDADTGQEVLTLDGFPGPVGAVAYSPDGRWLAVGSGPKNQDAAVELFDAFSGKRGKKFSDPAGQSVRRIVFSPDSRCVGAAFQRPVADRFILWEAETDRELLNLDVGGDTADLAFSPNDRWIAAATEDYQKGGTVRFWEAATGKPAKTFQTPGNMVGLEIAFNPDGDRLAWATSNGTSAQGGVMPLTGTEAPIRLESPGKSLGGVAFTRDGKQVAALKDGGLQLWNAATGAEARALPGVGGSPLVMLPDGERFATGGGAVRVWSLNPRQQQETEVDGLHNSPSIAFRPDGRRFALTTSKGSVRIIDTDSGRDRMTFQAYRLPTRIMWGPNENGDELSFDRLPGESSPIDSLAWSPDGRRLVTGGSDSRVFNGELYVWEMGSRRLALILDGHKLPVKAVAYSSDGAVIASASEDQTVRLWDAATGKELHALTGHKGSVRAVAFRPDGKFLVSASDDKTLRTWDVATGKEIKVFEGHTGAVNAVAFAPKGDRIASAGKDRTLRVWDADAGRELFAASEKGAASTGHTAEIACLSYDPDGNRIASAGGDGTVCLWNAHNGREVLSFKQGLMVKTVAFSPDGRVLAAGGWPHVTLWDASPADARREAVVPAALEAIRRGDDAFARDDFKAAVREYDAAAAADPSWAEPLQKRGNARSRLGEDARPDYLAALAARTERAVKEEVYPRAIAAARAARILAPADAEVIRRHGSVLASAKRYAEALAVFDEALKIEPANLKVLVDRGYALSKRKDNGAALAAFDLALKAAPEDAHALGGRVLVLELLGRADEAAQANARLLTAHPKDAMALCRRARDAASKGQWKQAEADFKEAARNDPTHWAPPYGLSFVAEQKGDAAAAMDQASAAIERRPDGALLYGSRAGILWGRHEPLKAIADCNSGLAVDPADAKLWERRGTYFAQLNDPEAAVADLTEAIRLNPKLTTARLNRAVTYSQTPRLRNAKTTAIALADLTMVIRLKPKDPSPFSTRGRFYSLQGDYRKSLADLDQAISMSPNTADFYAARGRAWEGLGENAKALADFDQALKLSPNEPGYHLSRGQHLAAQKQFDKALADFDAAIRADPKYAEAFAARGVLHHDRDRKPEAEADLAAAKKLNPKLASEAYQKGADLLERGQFGPAADEYTVAVLLDPRLFKAWHDRGVCRLRLRRYDEALADFTETVRVQPKFALAYKNRGAIHAMRKEFPEAITDFTKVMELTQPGDLASTRTEALTMRAEVYRETNKPDEALRDYTEVIRTTPSRAAFTARGEIYEKKGDAKNSAEDFARAASFGDEPMTLNARPGPAAPAIENYLPRDYDSAVAIRPKGLFRHPLMKNPPTAVKQMRDTLVQLVALDARGSETVERKFMVITSAGVVYATAFTKDFDAQATFQQAGGKMVATYKGVELWQVGESYGCMPHPRVLVGATTKKGLRDALDRAAGKPVPFDVPADGDVVIRVKDVKAVSQAMKLQQGQKAGKDELPAWTKSILSVTGVIKLGPAVEVEVVIDAGTAKAARSLVDNLNPQISKAAAAMRMEKYKPDTEEALVTAWVSALKFAFDGRYARFATPLDAKTGRPAAKAK